MKNRVSELTGADFPLFAFSHCRDVVVEVSKAGGFGVLGGSSFTPETLAVELDWIDANIDGHPYGVDILIPENQPALEGTSGADFAALIPDEHWEFTARVLGDHGVSFDRSMVRKRVPSTQPEIGEKLMDIAFSHPIKLIANALGIAPASMIERGKDHGVATAALIGAREHALRQVETGVDILVAQGAEAGGHCGEVSTMVLIPEVLKAIRPVRDAPVLAAGGIMTGAQMAACMAMGAEGAWTGSVWLATHEAETSPVFREKMIAASSRDTVRSKVRTGKYSRQLRSAWHDAWEGPDSPGALPMPLMGVLSQPAFERVEKLAEGGNEGAKEIVSYFVGQGVGLIDSVRSSGDVVRDFMEEFGTAVEHLESQLD
jgi:NAD(P)H-dependent flavin oxidoreductase YrpB (nitropropane dioxygenase family)